ncbi:MAG: magnesium/cobalt transporter CorA [Gemmataceae bacterium]
MIDIFYWNAKDACGQRLPVADFRRMVEEGTLGDYQFWIDLDKPSLDEESLILEKLVPVHPLSFEDITKMRREPGSSPHFPKAEEFAEYLFVIVNPLTMELQEAVTVSDATQPVDERTFTQLSAVLTKNMLITHHYEPVDGVSELHKHLRKHAAMRHGPDYLFHILLDTMVDNSVPFLEHINDCLDDIEDNVVDNPHRGHLENLFVMKRNILSLRKTLIYEREVLARLSRGEFDLIDERETIYYRNVYDHLIRFAELIEASREMVNDLVQLHLSAVNNKLSEVMKVLALISTVMLPMTVITGIYGMNFKDMPELDWKYGYPMVLGFMVFIASCAYTIFRWKKWL